MRGYAGLALCFGLACLLAAGCGGEKKPKNVQRAESVALEGAGGNKVGLKELVEEEGLAGLKRILAESDSSRARMVAITGLGMLKKDAEATELLVGLAEGEDSEEAHWAIVALADQGAPEARDLITKLLSSGDPRRREGACIAVKEYADQSLYPLLDKALNDPDGRVKAVAEQVKVLIRVGQLVREGHETKEGPGAGDE
ncbi:MAG: HEAT repeat domain-containing protein [Planctomycetes bacterium]|nr:HEAT repeat domain-containing protein [Planctomycetota bacterium]